MDVAKHLSETEQVKLAMDNNGLSEAEKFMLEEALAMSRDQRFADHVQLASLNDEMEDKVSPLNPDEQPNFDP